MATADPPSAGAPPAAPGARSAWPVPRVPVALSVRPLVHGMLPVGSAEALSPGSALAHSPRDRAVVGGPDAGNAQSLPQLAMPIGDPSMPVAMLDTLLVEAPWRVGTRAM